jgi:flavin reductase (DIM6/NTAB) family NADH-FMN oxidoreductase RutF
MVHGGPVGPFPEGREHDDYDRARRRVLWSLPTGLYVLGSEAGGRRNLMTLSWAMQLATEPKLVGVGIETTAVTHELVGAGGAFALSILAREDRALVRRFGKPLEDDGTPGALAGHDVRTAVTGAPILAVAAAWLDCRVVQTVELGSHSLFIGEVVDCAEDAEKLAGGVLRVEDTRMSYGG